MTQNEEVKVYTRRDSATAFLKKLGVPTTAYNQFITKHTDDDGDLFEVDAAGAYKYCTPAKATSVSKRAEASQVERRAGMSDLVEAQKSTAQALKETAETLASLKQKPGKKGHTFPRATSERTVSSVARALVIEGKSNDEIWKVLKQEFKLDPSKKHYPAWYRSEAKRKGLIK